MFRLLEQVEGSSAVFAQRCGEQEETAQAELARFYSRAASIAARNNSNVQVCKCESVPVSKVDKAAALQVKKH